MPRKVEVLLVEDNAGDIRLMRQALASERYPVSIRVATDGTQAAQILLESDFSPDVIILDLNLPKLSGLGFLHGYELDTPVVVFTSSSDPHVRERALELGAKEYIQKPTNLGEYMRLVSQAVRNWATPGRNGASAGK